MNQARAGDVSGPTLLLEVKSGNPYQHFHTEIISAFSDSQPSCDPDFVEGTDVNLELTNSGPIANEALVGNHQFDSTTTVAFLELTSETPAAESSLRTQPWLRSQPQASKRWATKASWSEKRPKIVRLYFEQDMTLKEVKRVMEDEDKFSAT